MADDPFAGIVDVKTKDGWDESAPDEVRDYSDAITRLIGGLAEVWRMPDARHDSSSTSRILLEL